MISLTNVSKVYGDITAVENLSFQVSGGENFILLGTSGCGKTTTLKMINGLVTPLAGTIRINEKDIRDLPSGQLRRGIGYVLQRNSLFPHYTVYENIAVVPRLLKWNKHKTDARIATLVQKLHLSTKQLSVYPNQLSGGEAQRVNLARALAAGPPVLLMDEPFSALDNITRSAIRKEFIELDELIKTTIIMVTHDVQEAFELGDRICLMDKGKVMQIGTPAELLLHPANEFVRDFLSGAFMQLSLSVVSIRDIWKYLANENETENINYIKIPSETKIGRAVEAIKDKNNKKLMLAITDKETNELKTANWESLLAAFSSYKSNQ